MSDATHPPLTVLIAGLGGQGVVLAGDLLISAALHEGFDVKKSEIHGLSRRFGSVSCQVRLGQNLCSPLRGHGGVDLLLAFEGYEALKQLPFLKPRGAALVNRLWRKPGARSPAEQSAPAQASDRRLQWFHGTEHTQQAESVRSLNFYMLGVLGPRLAISEQSWTSALDGQKVTDSSEANKEMFNAGWIAGRTSLHRATRAVPR